MTEVPSLLQTIIIIIIISNNSLLFLAYEYSIIKNYAILQQFIINTAFFLSESCYVYNEYIFIHCVYNEFLLK